MGSAATGCSEARRARSVSPIMFAPERPHPTSSMRDRPRLGPPGRAALRPPCRPGAAGARHRRRRYGSHAAAPDQPLRLAEWPATQERDVEHVPAEELDAARVVDSHSEEQSRQQVVRGADDVSPQPVLLLDAPAHHDIEAVAQGHHPQAFGRPPLAIAAVDENETPTGPGIKAAARRRNAAVLLVAQQTHRLRVAALKIAEDFRRVVGAGVVEQDDLVTEIDTVERGQGLVENARERFLLVEDR